MVKEDTIKAVKFRAEILKQTGELVFKYSVTNHTEQSIFLFNKIFTEVNEEIKYVYEKDFAYTYFQKNRLVVKKAIPVQPSDIDVEKPIVPLVTKVEAGETFSEQFEIKFPLKLWDPYRGNEIYPPGFFSAVELVIGYFSAPKEGEALGKKVETTNGKAIQFYPFNIKNMQTLSHIEYVSGNVGK